MGVEHEFFLLNENGSPVSFSESQTFLITISKLVDNDTFRESDVESISKISIASAAHGYAQIKYDHEPHLLEITTGYHDDLDSLNEELLGLFSLINKAVNELGFSISNTDFLDTPCTDPRIMRQTKEYENLRKFRRICNERIGKTLPVSLENYAAVIAATQTHIGGTELAWSDRPSLIHQLYMHESSILGWSNLGTNPKQRWSLYHAVYQHFPLTGFPKIEEWTLENWEAALLQSPILCSDPSTNGSRLGEVLTDYSDSEISKIIKNTRDLQIIRPKIFGTLEFRADPAQPTIERIMSLTALRLGISKAVVDGLKIDRDFKIERIKWWELAFQEKLTPNLETLEIAKQNLEKVKKNSSTYLEPYYAYARIQSA
jgi:hypothetical protein